MAEFGEQVATLSAPQGAGANVVSPVKASTSIVPDVLTKAVTIFAKGLDQNKKDEAEALRQAAINSYVREETSISTAFATGQIGAAEASARSKTNFRKHSAGYSEYITDFEEAGKALRGFTEIGDVEQEIKAERDFRQREINKAADLGLEVLPSMSDESVDSQIAAANSSIRATNAFDDLRKKNEELRAQGRYDRDVADREAKDLAINTINDIAGTHLEAFQSFGFTLAEDVRAGRRSFEEATQALSIRFNNISAGIQAAARLNPELAAPYRSLFDQMNSVLVDSINPTKRLDVVKSELESVIAKMKLAVMTSDPEVAGHVVANQLFPNNPNLYLRMSKSGVEAAAIAATAAPGADVYVPPIVSNPKIRDEVLNATEGALGGLVNMPSERKEEALKNADNTVNSILKEVGELISKGSVPPQALSKVAQFLASPNFGAYVREGKLSVQDAGAAKEAFKMFYEGSIISGVQGKMQQFVTTSSPEGFTASVGRQQPIGELIDINFTGSGIDFVPKSEGITPVARNNLRRKMQELNSSKIAINQLIHMTAHLEGTQDYNKVWEDNKYIWLPQIYPLRPGDIVNGYRYKGGKTNDPKSYESVGGGEE